MVLVVDECHSAILLMCSYVWGDGVSCRAQQANSTYMCMQLHTQLCSTCIQLNTNMHACTYEYIQICVCIDAYVHKYTCSQLYMHAHTHAHIATDNCTYTHTHTLPCTWKAPLYRFMPFGETQSLTNKIITQLATHTSVYAHTCAYTHTHNSHAHKHTQITNTHTHTHTNTCTIHRETV